MVKDFFVIGCLTGLRFSDISRIRPEYLDGEGFLNIRQKKTSGRIVIPLRKQMKEVLKKYNGHAPEIDSFTFNNASRNSAIMQGFIKKLKSNINGEL